MSYPHIYVDVEEPCINGEGDVYIHRPALIAAARGYDRCAELYPSQIDALLNDEAFALVINRLDQTLSKQACIIDPPMTLFPYSASSELIIPARS